MFDASPSSYEGVWQVISAPKIDAHGFGRPPIRLAAIESETASPGSMLPQRAWRRAETVSSRLSSSTLVRAFSRSKVWSFSLERVIVAQLLHSIQGKAKSTGAVIECQRAFEDRRETLDERSVESVATVGGFGIDAPIGGACQLPEFVNLRVVEAERPLDLLGLIIALIRAERVGQM